MASQPTPCANLKVAEFIIRGYHAYKDIWIPVPGEVLILKRKPTNVQDKSAVAIYNEGDVVGHVPYNISSLLSNFLKRETCVLRGMVHILHAADEARFGEPLPSGWEHSSFSY